MRVNPFYLSNLTASLNQTQVLQERLTQQLSNGVSITSLSDDPVGAAQNIVLLDQIQRDDSFTSSADMVTGQLQVADSALGSVVAELTQALSLATRANNGTMSQSDVKAVWSQLSGILSEVQSLANTTYQGRFIFAGGATNAMPFGTTAGVTSYSGDSDVNYLELPNGQQIQMNIPGEQIFLGSGTNNVFGSLNALLADYASGTVNLATAAGHTTALTNALNFVSQQRVIIDNSITQLSAASNAALNEKTQLLAAQTSLIQADLPAIATQLSQAQAQQTALISVIAQLESASNNLFSKM